jgi:methylase of polypeptide subunit release factors
VQVVDDRMTADKAYTLACEGTGLLWRGDFQNARQLVNAMARRADRKKVRAPADLAEAFRFHRQEQAQRARTLNMLLLQVESDHSIHLRRAPEVKEALDEAYGPASERYVLPMRELLGLIGAHEWRSKGIPIAFLGGNVHPHYGVFAPLRNEYLELIERAPLKPVNLAFDIGTGTGILALALARRGVAKIVATDIDPRALACAKENVARFALQDRIEVLGKDMFPEGLADLIVCNPPWIPARPSSSLERAVYDPKSQMLRAFLGGVAKHLLPNGEAWLVLSDLAERLGLRSESELQDLIDTSGLVVVAQLTTQAKHKKAMDPADPLHAARSAEVTSLWRLQKK